MVLTVSMGTYLCTFCIAKPAYLAFIPTGNLVYVGKSNLRTCAVMKEASMKTKANILSTAGTSTIHVMSMS